MEKSHVTNYITLINDESITTIVITLHPLFGRLSIKHKRHLLLNN